MRITKFGHACVRLEHEGTTLVLDPGMFTDPEAIDAADAKIREDAPEIAERTTVVSPGESFTAAGVPVAAVGELHAVIHDELPRFFNSGYRIEMGGQRLFHPGDALTGPDEQVDVLFLPVSAPWAASRDLID